MYRASYYTTLDDRTVHCHLCPHSCVIREGEIGKCMARVNENGILYTRSYGILSAVSSDPIEKKPLYHFFPGRSILSIGSFGCNMTCHFCQNCEISQVDEKIFSHYAFREPENIVDKASFLRNNLGLAYTYNEPTIYYEYMMECAGEIKKKGMYNAMVTNGFISRKPMEGLLPVMDAFNIDLKSFRDSFYREITGSRLNPVLRAIKQVVRAGKHLELTFLIIPGLNDSREEWQEMIRWIEGECGEHIPLHVSKYIPRYQMNAPPTPTRTIEQFVEMARKSLNYVYPGNTMDLLDSSTHCPNCGQLLVKRNLYRTGITHMDTGGHCDHCHTKIYGLFNEEAA